MSSSVGKRYEIRIKNKNVRKVAVGTTPIGAFNSVYPETELVSAHGDANKADVRIELLDGSRKSVTYFSIGAVKRSAAGKQPAVKKQPAIKKQPVVKKQPAANKVEVSVETITDYLRRGVSQDWLNFACRNILAKKSDNFGNTYVLCRCTWEKKEPNGYTGFYDAPRLVYHGAKGFTDITQPVLKNLYRGYFNSLNDIGADDEDIVFEVYKGNLVWFRDFKDVSLISPKGNVVNKETGFGEGEAYYNYTHKLVGDILMLEQRTVVNVYRPPIVHRKEIDLAQMLKSMK